MVTMNILSGKDHCEWEKIIFTLAGQSEAVNRIQSVITAKIYFYFEFVYLHVKLLQVTSLCHTESLEGIQ